MDPFTWAAALAIVWLAFGRGVSDIKYAGRGEMPPRTRERLAKLEAGRKSGRTGPAVGAYVADLFDEAVERRQAKRQDGPKAKPARSFVRNRYEDAWFGLEERIQRRRAVPVGRHAADGQPVPGMPVPADQVTGTQPNEPTGPAAPQPDPPIPTPTDPTPADPPPARSRRFDGQPETDADRRFFDLRESGYTGWIDQDGYAVDRPAFQRTEPTDPAGVDPTFAAQLDDIHTGGHNDQPADNPTTNSNGGTPMSTPTGEAYTVEQIRNNLEQVGIVANRYADGSTAQKLAAQDLTQTLENLSASATSQNANPAVLEQIATMLEQAQRVQDLADQLSVAAHDLWATSERATDDLNRTDGLIEETAASVGHIGERGLYQH